MVCKSAYSYIARERLPLENGSLQAQRLQVARLTIFVWHICRPLGPGEGVLWTHLSFQLLCAS